jgi:acyl CoA:acetate/3-ketoacid CoA transferase alpha subunit
VVALEQLPDLVPAGASVALGGAWFANHPMAAVRQLIRAGRTDIHLISILASIDAELMLAAGAIDHLTFGMVTMDAFGLPPLFRKAVQQGTLDITELTSISLQMALDAAGRNVPFLPFRGPATSELVERHPEWYATVDSPFGEGPTLVVKALQPDVAIVHALRCDAQGNAQFDGTYGQDPETVKAAKSVIVTCEEIVPTAEIAASPHMTKVPGFLVNAVIEVPFGAHPCSHVPRYAVDAWEILDYQRVASSGEESLAAYVATIRGETEDAYRARVLDGDRGRVLGVLAGAGEVLGSHS